MRQDTNDQTGSASTVFACAEPVLLRAAVRPAPAADPAPTGLAALEQAVADPLLYEAVTLASPSLTAVLDAVAAGRTPQDREVRRAARAVTRYRLRMGGRATPFGLMAGVAAAGFATEPSAHWGTGHTPYARADMGWMSGVVDRLEADPTVLALLRVTADDLCTVRGDRLVLPFVPSTDDGRQPLHEVSVRHTEAVRRTLELTATPLPWTELQDRLRAAYPDAPARTVERMPAELVRRGLLLTELRPPLDGTDPLDHVLGLLSGHEAELSPDSRAVVTELAAVRRDLTAYTGLPPGQGRTALAAVTTRMRRLRPGERTVQVDLALDARIRLPESVRAEAERAARTLTALAAGRPGAPHLRAFHADFLERYGTDRAVPLLELLDPERGLGLPSGYGPGPASAAPAHGDGPDARDRLLLALAQEASLAGERELVLDEELLTALCAGEAPADAPGPPPSFDLLTELLADSVEALAAGEFRLVVSGVSGVAGAVAGRFGHLLGEDAERLGRVVRAVPTRNPRAVRAQLAFRTRTGRAANVSTTPRWFDRTITVSSFTDRSAPHSLALTDLAVVADPRRLALVSASLGREVVPTFPSMLLPRGNAPGLARFLEEIARSGEGAWPGWDWGAAAALPFLPRVRHGRTVLSPARWRPADPALQAPATEPELWKRKFARWRTRAGVPRHVSSVYADHRIPLDLDDPAHLELLRHEWQRRPGAHLQEPPAANGHGHGWAGGRPTEIAFPLVRTTAGTAAAPVFGPARPRIAHGPGSSWLHAKLYCSPERQDALLVRELPGLLGRLPESVDRWFFLRYRDPAPHLRLRFHGTPADLGGTLLPRLGAWHRELERQGLCGRLAVDGYDPEWERYGGPEAMAAAEAAFEADSRACLEQLALTRSGALALDPRLLAAANYVDLLHRFHAGEDGVHRLLDGEGPEGRRAAPTALRREARRLVDPGGDWHGLGQLPGGAELLRVWERRGPAVTAYGALLRRLGGSAWGSEATATASLLHLHHNRLAGTDRKAETESLALARTAVRSHLDRKRAGA
ncbi:lantibiotic dehydratase [Streptomyces luteireticuli]|uniref:Lantibiotic dehydratase n=1 Tax=Streptomyces luteireticuli TaxID=173858 RepID=A0ABP3ITB3_9ACTN